MFIATIAMMLVAINPSSETASAKSNTSYDSVLKTAKKHLGARYVWGATGPTHFDCSGFTKYVYKKSIKKTIPRTAQQQYNHTKKVSKSNIKKGDLVYFGGSKHSISHVGMYIGNGKMITPKTEESLLNEFTHHGGMSLVFQDLLT